MRPDWWTGSRRFRFKRMTAEQLKAAMEELNLNMRAFAFLSGANERRIRSWLEGEEAIPPHVPVLLGMGTVPGALDMGFEIAEMFLDEEAEPGVEASSGRAERAD